MVKARGHVTYSVSPVHQNLFSDFKQPLGFFNQQRAKTFKNVLVPFLAIYATIKIGNWYAHHLDVQHRP